MAPRNPYIVGNPVGNTSIFVGRQDVLQVVVRMLRNPDQNAITLYGQRRIGKTSVLQYLHSHLPEQGNYRPVLYDLQDKAAWPLERLIGDLARKIAYDLNLPDPGLGLGTEDAFRLVWLPGALASLPDETALVLLFDEFDVLDDPKAEQSAIAFSPYLRQLLGLDPARLQFVFVFGRKVSDLSYEILSTFKGVISRHISLLKPTETRKLITFSEVDGGLQWTDAATQEVWNLTHGHPYLAQSLCSQVWDVLLDEKVGPAQVEAQMVLDAVDETLESSNNMLEYLWNGLGPAEKVVAAALAQAGPGIVAKEKLEMILRNSGVQVSIRELRDAPELLRDWDLLEDVDGSYRFRVELLRRWIAENKSLRRAQDELVRKLESAAERLYLAADGLFQRSDLDGSETLLLKVLDLSPDHLDANELLFKILISQGRLNELQSRVNHLMEAHPIVARQYQVRIYLELAKIDSHENQQLDYYGKVLELDPKNLVARAAWVKRYLERGETAIQAGNYASAFQNFKNAGIKEKIEEAGSRLIAKQEAAQDYALALKTAKELAERYPDELRWQDEVQRLAHRTNLAEIYKGALRALNQPNPELAIKLLVEIIQLEPNYVEATRYLHLAVTGKDPTQVENELTKVKVDLANANKIIEDLKARINKGQDDIVKLSTKVWGPLEKPPSSPLSLHHLLLWNPLDYLRLLAWLFFLPQHLDSYRQAYGKISMKDLGSRLAIMLVFLPLMLPMLGVGLGRLPLDMGVQLSSTAYLFLGFGLMLLAGILVAYINVIEKSAKWFVFVVVGMVTALVGITTVGVIGGTESILAIIVANLIVGGVAFRVANIVASDATFGVAYLIAGGVTSGVVTGLTSGLAFGAVGVIVFAVAFSVAFIAAVGIAKSPLWLRVGIFFCFLASFIFLVWFSFLGGWRAFQFFN